MASCPNADLLAFHKLTEEKPTERSKRI